MDQDFITELDAVFSNLGSDLLWKRNIGGVELWISPIQFSGQEKVVDAASKIELGANIINESKRITLSHAIVGVNDHDLRQYRSGQAVFPMRTKEGKDTKTTLDKYLYHKLGSWGFEFINNVFLVYADLMETYEKDNLKDIKFDNAKDLREELAELQAKVFELRQQLGMPPLVEGTEPVDDEISENEGLETFDEEPEEVGSQVPFDPFSVISHRAAHQTKQTVESRPTSIEGNNLQSKLPVHETTLLVAEGGEVTQRARDLAAVENSFPAQVPSVAVEPPIVQPQPVAQTQTLNDNIIEKPASRDPVALPVIDKTSVSRNPRFRSPGRVT